VIEFYILHISQNLMEYLVSSSLLKHLGSYPNFCSEAGVFAAQKEIFVLKRG